MTESHESIDQRVIESADKALAIYLEDVHIPADCQTVLKLLTNAFLSGFHYGSNYQIDRILRKIESDQALKDFLHALDGE